MPGVPVSQLILIPPKKEGEGEYHFALTASSSSAPGRGTIPGISPSVACLYRPYNYISVALWEERGGTRSRSARGGLEDPAARGIFLTVFTAWAKTRSTC